MVSYRDELVRAMHMLAEDERVVFIGQGVVYGGTFMSGTLDGIDASRKIEMPVAEEMQAGLCIGMALDGWIPVCMFPRWDFALCAASQLVSHMDVMRPKMIVRVGVGSSKPLDPGPQHVGDYASAFRHMLRNTPVQSLIYARGIVHAYRTALDRDGPTIISEYADSYDDQIA